MTLRRERPRNRRLFNTLRPPGELMRRRKPWVLRRLRTFGCHVLFGITLSLSKASKAFNFTKSHCHLALEAHQTAAGLVADGEPKRRRYHQTSLEKICTESDDQYQRTIIRAVNLHCQIPEPCPRPEVCAFPHLGGMLGRNNGTSTGKSLNPAV